MLEELIETAREYERAGAWDNALASYERALSNLSCDSSPALAADVLRWIGTVRRERGEMELAWEIYDVSLTIAELNGLPQQSASALNCMAIVKHRQGSVDEAESLYDRALAQAIALGNQRLAAMLDQNLGALQSLRGDLRGALASYESALHRSALLEDDATALRALNNMGMAHLRLGNLEAAEESLAGAISLAEATRDRLMTGTLELNRAGLHLQGKRHDHARACCDRAIELFGQLKSKQWTAEAYKFSGVLHREVGEPEQADACFALALGLAEVAQNQLLQAEAQLEWAVVHLEAGRSQQGISYLNQALDLFTRMHAEREVLDIRERLEKVESLYLPAVQRWSTTLMERTGAEGVQHAWRVADSSCLLAEALGLRGWDLTVVRVGSLIHDVGYTALSGGSATESRIRLQAHPLRSVHTIAGDAIARRLNFSAEIRAIVRHHHERWDGGGFPDGLAAEEIPLAARVVGVASAFDHLAHPDGRQRALTPLDVIATLREEAAHAFDPEVVEALADLFGETRSRASAA
ncbi:MAG TPA: tetratricopeptide repeat protein [Longimicrobiaceae bacterium]|nr:tetratricopeptide repeat protein [Longimicrobiaceae bacterium]